MRPEHHGPRFRRAVGVGDPGLGKCLVGRGHQSFADRRGAHADEFDAGEIGLFHRRALAQHHRDHRRHRRQPGRPVMADRLDVGLCLEARQQHDGRVRGAGKLRQRQRVHVIERGCDQIAMPVEVGREPRLHHPDMALVRQHHALRQSGRARRVEKHRGLAVVRDHGFELAGVDEAAEAFVTLRAEHDRGKAFGAIVAARSVAEQEPRAGVLQDEMDGLARETIVHRHRDKAGAHDAEIGRDKFGAVGREDGNPVAARKPASGQRAGDGHRHAVELGIGVFDRRLLAAQIDDRDLGEVGVVADQIAEILEARRHHAFGGGGGAVK